MKTHYAIIGLIILSFLFLGCAQSPKNNLPQANGADLNAEVDAGWINDTPTTTGEMVATDADAVASETSPLDENQQVLIGEMI